LRHISLMAGGLGAEAALAKPIGDLPVTPFEVLARRRLHLGRVLGVTGEHLVNRLEMLTATVRRDAGVPIVGPPADRVELQAGLTIIIGIDAVLDVPARIWPPLAGLFDDGSLAPHDDIARVIRTLKSPK
jgi:hypothetical protein